MAEFVVSGPFDVELERHATGAVSVDRAKIKDLCAQCAEFDKEGCYVFALKAPKGLTPNYVGRATKRPLRSEAFNERNQNSIFNTLNARTKHAKLVIFLVTQKRSRGKPNLSVIDEIEEFLIANAAAKTSALLNKKGVVKESWAILGVYNAPPGKPDAAAREFKRALGIAGKRP
jgi:hypothetical protein